MTDHMPSHEVNICSLKRPHMKSVNKSFQVILTHLVPHRTRKQLGNLQKSLWTWLLLVGKAVKKEKIINYSKVTLTKLLNKTTQGYFPAYGRKCLFHSGNSSVIPISSKAEKKI